MTEQKVLIVHLKDRTDLYIVSTSIQYVEELSKQACRIHYANDKVIDVLRDKDWMLKFLVKAYDKSEANEL